MCFLLLKAIPAFTSQWAEQPSCTTSLSIKQLGTKTSRWVGVQEGKTWRRSQKHQGTSTLSRAEQSKAGCVGWHLGLVRISYKDPIGKSSLREIGTSLWDLTYAVKTEPQFLIVFSTEGLHLLPFFLSWVLTIISLAHSKSASSSPVLPICFRQSIAKQKHCCKLWQGKPKSKDVEIAWGNGKGKIKEWGRTAVMVGDWKSCSLDFFFLVCIWLCIVS